MKKNDVIVKVNPIDRKVYLNDNFLGLNAENLQSNLVFEFDGDFVNGTPRVEVEKNGNKYIITEVSKVNDTYVMEIKSSLLTTDVIWFQLVITEVGDEEIPIFKSRKFFLEVKESINASTELPDEYQTLYDQIEEKIAEVDNLNITAERVSDGVEIDITDKTGETTTTKVNDGLDGKDGKGIDNIEKISTSGLIDTYAITYNDGSITTYEVKNGYPTSDADTSIVGQKGYYIHSINTSEKWIILSESETKPNLPEMGNDVVDDSNPNYETGYSIDDEFSIINSVHYDFCGKITEVIGNKIYYSKLPFSEIDTTSVDNINHCLFVPSKPKVGIITITDVGFASGINAIASGKASISEGRDTIAGGDYSATFGRRNKASYGSLTYGLDNFAKGRYSQAGGTYSQANGEYSVALGCVTKANGESSAALNNNTKATGGNSIATGHFTEANGFDSSASGANTKANGEYSTATGNQTRANGDASFTMGYDTEANGGRSVAEGSHTIADGDYMHVSGKYNRTTGNKAIVVGNGTNNNNRSDAYTLDWEGNGKFARSVNTELLHQDYFNNGKATGTILNLRNFDDLIEPGFYQVIWYHTETQQGGALRKDWTPWNVIVAVRKLEDNITNIWQVREAYGANSAKTYWKDYRQGIANNGVVTWGQWERIKVTNLAYSDVNNNFSTAQTINGNLTVVGNISQTGTQYETHAEQLFTKKDLIKTRDGAVGGLGNNEVTGIEAIKYDGTNNGRLVFDNTGTAKVGDVGDEVPLLARDEATNLTNGQVLVWDSTNLIAKGSSDFATISYVNGLVGEINNELDELNGEVI